MLSRHHDFHVDVDVDVDISMNECGEDISQCAMIFDKSITIVIAVLVHLVKQYLPTCVQ
jgi:hypothetical protein